MINLEKLISMMDGDAALAQQFLVSFKDQVKDQLPLMDNYLRSKDWPMLANILHIMKTQTAYVGLEEISEESQNIEMMIDGKGKEEDFIPRVEKLMAQLSLIIN